MEGGQRETGGYAPRGLPERDRSWQESWYWQILEEMAGMVELVWRCARVAVKRPLNWRGELLDESARIVRRTAIPLALAISFFIFGGVLVTFLLAIKKLGAEDRLGYAVAAAGPREFDCWITGMCVAGIAGTAVCSDLGSRKVREELDAMIGIGLDPYRLLVLPRLLAITALCPLMLLWAHLWSMFVGGFAGSLLAGFPLGTYIHSASTYSVVDLYGGVLKMTVIGFVIGVTSCYMGMSAKGGPAGVARAVNRAVVVSFAATWILNYLINSIVLAAVPAAQNIR